MISFSRGILQSFQRRLQSLSGPEAPDEPELTRTHPVLSEEVVRRFKPPELGWLGQTILLTGLHACYIGSLLVLFYVTRLDEVVPGDLGLRGLVTLLVYLAAFYRGRWLAEREREAPFGLWLLKLLLLVMVARLTPYLLDPARLFEQLPQWFRIPITFFTTGFLINLLLVGLSFRAGDMQARRLLKMYVRPQEVSFEQGGTAVGTGEWVNRSQVYKELRLQLALGGFAIGLVVAVLALISVDNPATVQPALEVVPLLLAGYVSTALLLLSWLRLRYLRTTWRMSELREPPGLYHRWNYYLALMLLLAAGIALVLPHSSNLQPGGSGLDWLSQVLGQDVKRRQADLERRPPQPPAERLQLPDLNWLLYVVLIVAGIFSLLALIWLIRNIDWLGNRRLKRKLPRLDLARLWLALAAAWQALLGWCRSLFRRLPSTGGQKIKREAGDRRGWFSRFSRERLPDDPRSQVRYYYRQTLRRAARAGVPRRPPQTPYEYSGELQRYVGPGAPPEPANPAADIEQLSAAYEEARFSPHPVSPEQVGEVSARATRLNAALRQARKHPKT